jgi:signal-transduction protein with cAMP-binding, CBS, and nucleotidyltransferase domain
MSTPQSRKTVAEMMVTDVVTIPPFAKLREAIEVMRDRKVKSLVVEKQSPADAWGILTYTMLLRAIVHEDGDVDLVNVYDVAAKPALIIPPQLEVRHAVTMMLSLGVKRLVVTSNNELEGILTMNDIVGAIIEKIDA